MIMMADTTTCSPPSTFPFLQNLGIKDWREGRDPWREEEDPSVKEEGGGVKRRNVEGEEEVEELEEQQGGRDKEWREG